MRTGSAQLPQPGPAPTPAQPEPGTAAASGGHATRITTVVVVDDHPGVRTALEALIAGADDLQLVGSASGGAEAIAVVAALEPKVVVMDLAMPGTGGVEATRAICRRRPAPAVVAFSGSRELWRDARAAGAAHAVLKDDDPERLLDAIRDASVY